MRVLVAVILSAVVVAMSAAPHVHDGAHGDHDCPACLARTIEPARTETPNVAPVRVQFFGAVFEPTLVVPAGAPLGAVPGQSPPVSA